MRADGRTTDSPGLFRSLRRIHCSRNLDSGLNDLTEAFATFVTRAKYFSVGHLRRTWSHSAVEFMKYRRRLPAILSDEPVKDENDNVTGHGQLRYSRKASLKLASEEAPTRSDGAQELEHVISRHLFVQNVPAKVTNYQLATYFSKFGPVESCYFPRDNGGGTLPRKSKGTAYVTFCEPAASERAIHCHPTELTLYNSTMTLIPLQHNEYICQFPSANTSIPPLSPSLNTTVEPMEIEEALLDQRSYILDELGEDDIMIDAHTCDKILRNP